MEHFLSWNKWLSLRESNARKRAVNAATNGLATPMPGSTAACPNTNPVAMDQASKNGVVGKSRKKRLQTESEQKPNHSFDHWLGKVMELGKEIKGLMDKGNDEDAKIEKKSEEAKKDIEKAEKADKAEKSKPKTEKAEKPKADKKDPEDHEEFLKKVSKKLDEIKPKKHSK